jgi:hypothetical protein
MTSRQTQTSAGGPICIAKIQNICGIVGVVIRTAPVPKIFRGGRCRLRAAAEKIWQRSPQSCHDDRAAVDGEPALRLRECRITRGRLEAQRRATRAAGLGGGEPLVDVSLLADSADAARRGGVARCLACAGNGLAGGELVGLGAGFAIGE